MDEFYARNAVARQIVAEWTRIWAQDDSGSLDWEDFPDVGLDDWNQIIAEVLIISANLRPPAETVEAAVEFLKGRADG